ncbi:AAA family ATPase [Siminovitchia fortis]|uniref:ATP-binding cassette domain-containing protein n=1 Tax=Siminovitchia fortis TaxID=254758 RepID=A0A443IJC3_9BACI|nr:AAA family ATPase [Siminovitchia fortis]RWR04404.1 ATP-binding cassette domain-containing protein [Siminovitchia fortis]WHY82450.1 AAA family ATPase [Siminovitchia fortis]
MVYLHAFSFPNEEMEFDFFIKIKRTCYDSFYPFKVLSRKGFETIVFEPVTILYGGNGSGKSTALNVIAEKTGSKRDSIFNKSNFYPDYVNMCEMQLKAAIPENSRIITSDDVFDYMLNIRNLNEGIDQKREQLFEEYLDAKYSQFQMKSMADYEQLKKINTARSKTQSRFVRNELMDNVREYSNGESAFRYFTEKIGDNGLYILDEPENSLSPKRQMELVKFLEDSARFFGCQFIISTHSPFLLSMREAKIYNLDENPVKVRRWTELENVRTYYEFFKKHENKFQL